MGPSDRYPWGADARDRLLACALIPGLSSERAVAARLGALDTPPGHAPPSLPSAARARWHAAAGDPRFAARVAAERAALADQGAWWLTPVDPGWSPTWPVGVLRGRGALSGPGVAIVGARRADGYGIEITRRVAQAAVERGFTVVSGGAFGVDHAAHRAALDLGGRTTVVLGSGLSHPSPATHRALFDEALQRGAVVSPFPCDQAATRWTFPRRNPWIAGLSAAVIVVQAGARSGALHTARAALELGIPVFAAPGPMHAPLHAGCHALIDEGARILTAPDGWLPAVGPSHASIDAPNRPAPPRAPPADMPPAHRALWTAATVEPRPLAELAEAAGLAIATAAQAATLLELDGWLRPASGGRYARG